MSMRFPLALLALLAAACGAGDAAPTPASTAGGNYTPDSTRQAELDRFRAGLPEVHELTGGADSREALVQDFLAAAEARDTTRLEALVLSRAEFAWLYYPTAQQALPPYDLDPETLWLLTSERGGRGLYKAMEALGGRSLPYVGHSCDPGTSREGKNTVHGPCLVRLVQAPGDTVATRLFGLVLERGGRWKFVSYSNKLD